MRFSTLILDIGDVLFTWSAKTKTTISPRLLKEILVSTTWFEYERGRISQAECYERVGQEFSLQPQEIAQAFEQARESMVSNDEMIALVHQLKSQSNGTLRVFALSNISQPDYEYLLTKPADWSVFDKVFASALIGERKPHLGCYRHVIEETGIDPRTTVFVDDKIDNVLSARSLGMHGIVFEKQEDVARELLNLFGDPVQRGQDFLRQSAGALQSVTSQGQSFDENFTQLFVLEVTGDESLVNLEQHPRTWNFFKGKPLFSETFPDDMDTTSVALTVVKRDPAVISSVMDEMLEYRDADGLMLTYFDKSRQRLDPCVCVNVLTLFYSNGRGHDLDQTLDWVHDILINRAYLGGTRYYAEPECFLFFLSRLLTCSNDAVLQRRFRDALIERISERVGAAGDAMVLAMRLLACYKFGIPNEVDLQKLITLQCADGSWEAGSLYKFGQTGLTVGSRGLTTALAVKAIELGQKTRSKRRSRSPIPIITSVLKIDIPKPHPSPSKSTHGASRPTSPLFRHFRLPWRRNVPFIASS